MPNSMTGFARLEHQAPWGNLSCELRSVNHRYLEPLIRVPENLRYLEVPIRELCRKQLQRGKVEISLHLNTQTIATEGLALNQGVLEQLAQAIESARNSFEANQDVIAAEVLAPVDPLKLLQWPGVIEQQGVDEEAIAAAAKTLVADAFDALVRHRQREGVELQHLIEQRLDSISDYVAQVREQMPQILQNQQDKLQQRIEALQVELDPERLEQEIALLANKADVDEELDRLVTHIAEVRHILEQKGAIGRRLDFMMQELNREANTLSSKSIHTDTTQAAVSLKVLIEQMREQIQNIE